MTATPFDAEKMAEALARKQVATFYRGTATPHTVATVTAELAPLNLDALRAAEASGYRRGLEEAAKIVDDCNAKGPYLAIGAASRIRSLVECVCGHGAAEHAVDDEERRECMRCGCREYADIRKLAEEEG